MSRNSAESKKFITKTDLILIGILLICGFGFLLWRQNRTSGEKVLIWVDNEQIASFPLHSDGIFILTNDYGTNTVVIENGEVFVKDADCPDKICEEMGSISKPGETIVCLPHRLIVEVSDESR